MFRIKRKLNELRNRGEKINLALVGCGKMGASLLSQINKIDGMDVVLVVDHTTNKAKNALIAAGIDEEKIFITDDLNRAIDLIDKGYYVVTENYKLSYKLYNILAVIDATGNPPFGAKLAAKSIEYHKHVIMLNVECDAVVGPILYDMAQKAGVVYTGSAGDEPGAIIDLCDFAFGAGFDILVAAKGKNNPLDNYKTPEDLADEAKRKNLSAKMLTSFVDGTNTMIELNSVCNCLGFIPDCLGCHGIKTDTENAVKDFRLETDGGVLKSYHTVEFSEGMAPGVFLIVTSDKKEVRDLMKYLGMGDGPNYLLYRPYHLTSLETPISIYNAVVEHEPTIAPLQGQVADTVTVAKRDIKKGELLEGIGSAKVFGKLTTHDRQVKDDLLPIALITQKTYALCDIKKDTLITQAMVQLDEDEVITKLRRKQDSMKL